MTSWGQRVFWLSLLLCACGAPTLVLSQEQAEEPEEPVLESPRVAVISAVADAEGGVFLSEGASVSVVPMAFPGSEGMLHMGMGGMMPNDDLGMLAQDQFQGELELVPQQREQLKALRNDIHQRRQKIVGDLRTIEPQKMAAQFRELETQIQTETREKLHEILLPHQLDRLKQLKIQMQMRSRGLTALAGSEWAASLNLTEEQKKKLAEKQADAMKQLREKMEEIRRQLQEDVINEVLTAEQRSKLTNLTGSEFKIKPLDPPVIRAEPGTKKRVIRATQ